MQVINDRRLFEENYGRVQMQELLSDAKQLLKMDQNHNGTGTTSFFIAKLHNGGDSLLRLKGLGKYLWRKIDAQDYINQLRHEWD